jgi:transcriptional regulator
MSDRQRALLPGTVDLVILRTLSEGPAHGFAISRLSEGPAHGFAISRRIRARSEGVLELQDAALYQALHRMEKKGWISSQWGQSENNRRAKFYDLTTVGTKRLAAEARSWREYAAAIASILEPAPAEQE